MMRLTADMGPWGAEPCSMNLFGKIIQGVRR